MNEHELNESNADDWLLVLRTHANETVRGALKGLTAVAVVALVRAWAKSVGYERIQANAANVKAFITWAVLR